MAVLGFDDVTAGRWNEAEAAANEALRLCTLHGYRIVEWPFWLILMQVAACRGDDKAVAAAVAQLNSWAGPRGVRGVQHYAHRVLALAALGRGDFEDAYRSCREITAPGSLPADLVHAVWISLELVESAMRTNRPVEAAAHARVLQASEVGSVTPRLTMIVAGVAALVAPDEEAFVLFEQALSVPGMARWPWDRARMQLLYGERLRRARAVSRARVQLSAALSTFRGLGAGPWAARAARELEAAGGGHRRPDDPAPSQLTPQEYEVAVLAADGLTNKQIAGRLLMSHRTVAAHLRQTFAKLQITTRGALRYELTTARGTGPV
jgi:DNA-binding CsgD family transcriptional regulator